MQANVIVCTRNYTVMEHDVNPNATLEQVLAFMRAHKITGELKYVTRDGGRRAAVITERRSNER